MRILVLEFITTVGGVQQVYKQILPHLAEIHDVVFCDPYNNPFDAIIARQENKVKLLSLNIITRSALGWGKNTYLRNLAVLLREGYGHLGILVKLMQYVRNTAVDCIYVGGKKELLFAFVIKKLTGIKYIYHCHGFGSPRDITRWMRAFIQEAEAIIAVSECTRNMLISAGINRIVRVVHNGITTLDDLPSYPSANLSDEFRILFVGTVQPQKGVHVLLEAMGQMIKSGRMCTLDIVGQANQYHNAYYEGLLTVASHFADRVKFHGQSDRVYDFIRECDVLVLPSLHESFGLVLLEAMMMGKPVVASNTDAIPEIVRDGVTGLLFNAGDAADLYRSLLYLYKNREIGVAMGKRGKQLVRDRFSVKVQVLEILDCLAKSL